MLRPHCIGINVAIQGPVPTAGQGCVQCGQYYANEDKSQDLPRCFSCKPVEHVSKVIPPASHHVRQTHVLHPYTIERR